MESMKNAVVAAWAAAVVVGMIGSTALAGPVRIVSQERSIIVHAQGGGSRERITDRQVSEGNDGRFVATVATDDTNSGAIAKSSASVDSDLGPSGFEFRGRLQWDLQDLGAPESAAVADARYDFHVVFALDQAYHYAFVDHGKLDHSVGGSSAGDAFEFLEGPGVADRPDAGILQAGTYSLQLSMFQGSAVSDVPVNGSYLRNFDLSLNFAPVAGEGSEGPHPVPLPAALWSGLSVLGACAVNRMRKTLAR
jgi:hypothetical protein